VGGGRGDELTKINSNPFVLLFVSPNDRMWNCFALNNESKCSSLGLTTSVITPVYHFSQYTSLPLQSVHQFTTSVSKPVYHFSQ